MAIRNISICSINISIYNIYISYNVRYNIYSALKYLRNTAPVRFARDPSLVVFRSAWNQASRRRYAQPRGVPALSLRWFTLRGETTNACASKMHPLRSKYVSYEAHYLHNDGSWWRTAMIGYHDITNDIRLFYILLLSMRLVHPTRLEIKTV